MTECRHERRATATVEIDGETGRGCSAEFATVELPQCADCGAALEQRTEEGQFHFDELGQRTCLRCGAAICAGCTPEKCGTPCEACVGECGAGPDGDTLLARAINLVVNPAARAVIDDLRARVATLQAEVQILSRPSQRSEACDDCGQPATWDCRICGGSYCENDCRCGHG